MVAEVLLKSLNVEDYIDEDPSPEFKKIISSRGFGVDEEKDLFNLKFVKVNDGSPELDSTYEGIATHLHIDDKSGSDAKNSSDITRLCTCHLHQSC